jgi:ribosomal protein S12 methylthiotransferase accessory factor
MKKQAAGSPAQPPAASEGLDSALPQTSTPTSAAYFLGTHRIRSPEATWRWIEPWLPRAGITRVADITGLDSIGLPVFQAVRPASRNLSVSQGKAMTPMAAKVSAVMESIELWHAECLDQLPQAKVSLQEMRYSNPIPLRDLKWKPDTRLLEAWPLAWVQAQSLLRESSGWVPRQMVELDLSLPEGLEPQMFYRTSNGLASGNCLEEALIHALCELVERHALFLLFVNPFRKRALAVDSLRGTYCWPVVERLRQAGMKIALWDISWEVGLPCAIADIVAPDLPNVWRGSGCHLDPEVALSRALNEAAQSRLTYIAGARDDLTAFSEFAVPHARFESFQEPVAEVVLDDLPHAASGDLARDLSGVVERLDALGFEPFWVDFRRPEVGVPVVNAFIPGIREAPYG